MNQSQLEDILWHLNKFENERIKGESDPYIHNDSDHIDDPQGDSNATDANIAKATAMVVLFSASTLCGSIPFLLNRWFKWTENNTNARSATVVKCLLYFGGGVLLCTTFLHLLPEVNENIEELQANGSLPSLNFHLPELLTCLGFFAMYFVEECIHAYIHKHQKSLSEDSAPVAFQRGQSIRDSFFLNGGRKRTKSTDNDTIEENNKSLTTTATTTTTTTGTGTRIKSSPSNSLSVQDLIENPKYHTQLDMRSSDLIKRNPQNNQRDQLSPTDIVVHNNNNNDSNISNHNDNSNYNNYQNYMQQQNGNFQQHQHNNHQHQPLHHHHHHQHDYHHGHSHLPSHIDEDMIVSSLRGLLVVLALSLHELFEGLAVGLESSAGNVWYMFGAVSAHKLVLAFCVGVELIVTKTRLWLSIIYVITFAIVSPIGIGIGILVSNEKSTASAIPSAILQGLATGTLLYVVFFEILSKERSGLLAYLAFITGFLVMFGLQFAKIRSTFNNLQQRNIIRIEIENFDIQISELLICCGFFLIYILEEIMHYAIDHPKDHKEFLLHRTLSTRKCKKRQLKGKLCSSSSSSSNNNNNCNNKNNNNHNRRNCLNIINSNNTSYNNCYDSTDKIIECHQLMDRLSMTVKTPPQPIQLAVPLSSSSFQMYQQPIVGTLSSVSISKDNSLMIKTAECPITSSISSLCEPINIIASPNDSELKEKEFNESTADLGQSPALELQQKSAFNMIGSIDSIENSYNNPTTVYPPNITDNRSNLVCDKCRNITITETETDEDHGYDDDNNDDNRIIAKENLIDMMRGLITIFALSIHGLFEGLALGLEKNYSNLLSLVFAIGTHKFVIIFCVGMELISAKLKSLIVFIYILGFSIVTPMGILIGTVINDVANNVNNNNNRTNNDSVVSGDNNHNITTITTATIITVAAAATTTTTTTITTATSNNSDNEANRNDDWFLIFSAFLQAIAAGTLLYVIFFEILVKERDISNGKRFIQIIAIICGFLFMMGMHAIVSGHQHTHSHGGGHGHSHEHNNIDGGGGSSHEEHDHDHDHDHDYHIQKSVEDQLRLLRVAIESQVSRRLK